MGVPGSPGVIGETVIIFKNLIYFVNVFFMAYNDIYSYNVTRQTKVRHIKMTNKFGIISIFNFMKRRYVFPVYVRKRYSKVAWYSKFCSYA